MAKAPALSGFELPLERRLPRIGSVDEVAVEERAAELSRRSIKLARALATFGRPDSPLDFPRVLGHKEDMYGRPDDRTIHPRAR